MVRSADAHGRSALLVRRVHNLIGEHCAVSGFGDLGERERQEWNQSSLSGDCRFGNMSDWRRAAKEWMRLVGSMIRMEGYRGAGFKQMSAPRFEILRFFDPIIDKKIVN